MPSLDFAELFGTSDSAVQADRFMALKAAIEDGPASNRYDKPFQPNLPALVPQQDRANPLEALKSALADPILNKAIGADVLASVEAQLAAQPDLVKDLTLTSPLSTGYVAYDLEAPAKMLTPRPTPLRNRIPRRKGVGIAHKYKRITGFTGSGTGGVGNVFPGITDTTTNTFGSISYLRGPKISYAGDEATIPYLQYSLSDQLPWSNQFSAQGFQDMRALSRTSLLRSSMLMEERMLLGSRGTAAGFLGALTAPGTVTATVRTAAGAEVGNTANIATVTIGVSAITQFGETVPTFSSANTNMSAATGKVVDVSWTNVVGAQAYKVYIGISSTISAQFPAVLTIGNTATQAIGATPVTGVLTSLPTNQVSSGANLTNTFGVTTINFTGGGTGGLPNAGLNPIGAGGNNSTTANESSLLAYDGIVPICQGANAGYTKVLGTTFSSNPGDEYNVAFGSLWDSVKADPDQILFNGADRKQLSDLIKLNSSTSSYRISLTNDNAHDATIGAVVTGLQNEVTGKMVDLTVHPWLFQGVTPILSWTLPIPDTEVTDCFAAYNVQDYMAIEWPVLQFAYEASTYWYGTFFCYAAAWQGSLSGIVKK